MISQILLLFYNCFRNFTWIFICLMGTERRKCFFCFFLRILQMPSQRNVPRPTSHVSPSHLQPRNCTDMQIYDISLLISFIFLVLFCITMSSHTYTYIPLFRCHLANEPTRTKHMAHDTSKLFKAATFK